MSVVQIYRAFRTRVQCVYERHLSDISVLAMVNTEAEYIQWMLEVPTIFTKASIPALSNELANLPWRPGLNNLICVIEAYPHSCHNGAAPELGIIISINYGLRVGKYVNQKNWMYDHCYIVDQNGRTRWLLKDLPKKPRRGRDPK